MPRSDKKLVIAYLLIILSTVLGIIGIRHHLDSRQYKTECRRYVMLSVDQSFSQQQQLSLWQAAMAWQIGSNKAVCFLPGTGGYKIENVTDPIRVNQVEITGTPFVDKPEKLVGLTAPPNVYILTGKLETDDQFYAVVIHEIGHVIGLGHMLDDKNPSWMHTKIDNAPRGMRTLTPVDKASVLSHEGH